MSKTKERFAAAVFAGSSQIADPEMATRVHFSAVDIADLLAGHNWQVIVGGYDLGPMGTVSCTAYGVSELLNRDVKPLGIVFRNLFPNDEPIKGEIVNVKNLAQRQEVFFEKANAFFILGGGGLGVLSEIFGALKDEDLKQEATQEGHVKFNPRPFFVIDPENKILTLLTSTFRKFDQKKAKEPLPGLLDRVYVIGPNDLVPSATDPKVLAISGSSKSDIVQVLDAYSKGKPTVVRLNTLRAYLDNFNTR